MNVDTLLETTVLYFKVKKVQNTLLPFSWYKKQIQYISKIHDESIVRMVFNKLLKKNILHKFKHRKSTFYIFNPYIRLHIQAAFNVQKKACRVSFT